MVTSLASLSSHRNPEPETKARRFRRPRILIVTPELNGSAYLGRNGTPGPRAKAGGLADISTLLVDELSSRGIDVRVAMPHFRNLFPEGPLSRRLHLCSDREFFYRRSVYDGSQEANRRAALAFQREVIQNIIPAVRPDVVHCHDWMTGLVPAAAKAMGIRSLFTVHNLHDEVTTMAEAEDRGIDTARFWQNLHFGNYPHSYEESRSSNPLSMMASAIHASDHVNTVSPTFLQEMMDGRHVAGWGLCDVLRGKQRCGAASGILNAPDPDCAPERDLRIAQRYGPGGQREAKRANKLELQKQLGLEVDAEAPLLFWPSRLDPTQKGCGLLAHMLYQLVSDYSGLGLQVVFVADGPFRPHFEQIVNFHGLHKLVAVRGFEEGLSRQAYAASDFTLVPSAYEPCGLAQMVAMKYGSLPVVHKTGGLQDTVQHLSVEQRRGNGFVFETHDCGGLRWAIDEAIRFYLRPGAEREREIARVMRESAASFSPQATAEAYIRLYEQLSGRIIGGPAGPVAAKSEAGFRPVRAAARSVEAA